MAGEWPNLPFQQLLVVPVRNGVYKSKEYHGRGLKIVNMGELFANPRLHSVPMKRVELSSSECERFTIAKDDLLFARRSLVAEGAGKCCIVLDIDEPTTFESSIIRARPEVRKVSSLFLYYYFNSTPGLHALDTIRRQVAVAGITGSDLSRLLIPVPSLHEQRAIAHILGSLDDKIELNRKMNETLEAMAQKIFKSWFVDFDPVRAKAEGRKPVGMDEETARLFPDSFVDSDLGKIPKGWSVKRLTGIATFMNGLAMQKYPPSGNGDVPVIKIAELRRGNTVGSDLANPSFDTKYLVTDGDILFSWSGSLEVCIWCGGKGGLNQHLFKVTSCIYPKWFFYQWVREHLDDFRMIAAGKATTMGHIQRHHLDQALVVVPDAQVIKMATIVMDPLVERYVLNNLESQTLSSFRDNLLPKILSGEIRVKEAEKVVESVT